MAQELQLNETALGEFAESVLKNYFSLWKKSEEGRTEPEQVFSFLVPMDFFVDEAFWKRFTGGRPGGIMKLRKEFPEFRGGLKRVSFLLLNDSAIESIGDLNFPREAVALSSAFGATSNNEDVRDAVPFAAVVAVNLSGSIVSRQGTTGGQVRAIPFHDDKYTYHYKIAWEMKSALLKAGLAT